MAQETSGGGAKGADGKGCGYKDARVEIVQPEAPMPGCAHCQDCLAVCLEQNHKVYINCTLLSNSKHHFCHKIEKDIF